MMVWTYKYIPSDYQSQIRINEVAIVCPILFINVTPALLLAVAQADKDYRFPPSDK